jgi:hypothetical protein
MTCIGQGLINDFNQGVTLCAVGFFYWIDFLMAGGMMRALFAS